jgi:phage terminase large subunit
MKDSFVLSNVPTESNVYLPATYFDSLEKQYSGAFKRQELYGEFVRFEGLVYDYSPTLITEEQAPKHPDTVAYGVDWGYKNPSCILAIEVKDGIYQIMEEFYKTKVTDYELTEVARDMQDRHGVGVFYCDPSSPQSIEIFKREGINAVKAINEINSGVRAVASLIAADKLVIHERCHNLINELQTYSYADGDRDTPIKLNDHACDALRYAIQGINAVVEPIKPVRAPPMMFPERRSRWTRKY